MKHKIPLIVLCLMFLGIASYSGVRMYQQWSEYRAGEVAYEALAEYVQFEAFPTSETSVPESIDSLGAVHLSNSDDEKQKQVMPSETSKDTTHWPIVNFEALRVINPDVVAWIYIEGTSVNYPVVQGADNRYYLNRLFDGGYNSAGTIFMDYRNEGDMSNRNIIFYGHNLKNGSMFEAITEYKDQSFYDDHPVCLIMTPEENYTLEFFAGYVTDMNNQAWKLEFGSDEEFKLWLDDAVSRSEFSSDVNPTAQDRVVTFSTCTYEYDNARFVLHGILR